MKEQAVTEAIIEAERFVAKAKAALLRQKKVKHAYPGVYAWEPGAENAACKRASMDLTKALVNLRKA